MKRKMGIEPHMGKKPADFHKTVALAGLGQSELRVVADLINRRKEIPVSTFNSVRNEKLGVGKISANEMMVLSMITQNKKSRSNKSAKDAADMSQTNWTKATKGLKEKELIRKSGTGHTATEKGKKIGRKIRNARTDLAELIADHMRNEFEAHSGDVFTDNEKIIDNLLNNLIGNA